MPIARYLTTFLITLRCVGLFAGTELYAFQNKGAKMFNEHQLTMEEALLIKAAVLKFIQQSKSEEIRLLQDTIASEEPEFITEPDFSENPILVIGLWIFDEQNLTITKRVSPGHSHGIEYIAQLKKADEEWIVESIKRKKVKMKW